MAANKSNTKPEAETVTLPPEQLPETSTGEVPTGEAVIQLNADGSPATTGGFTDLSRTPEPAAQAEAVIDLSGTGVGETVIGGGVEESLGAATPVGITLPIVEPVQDAAELDPSRLDSDALRSLDETDSFRAAAIRRQENWAADAAQIFKGPTEDQRKLEAHLKALDDMDAANRAAQKQADEEKALAEEDALIDKSIADLEAEYEQLKDRALAVKTLLAEKNKRRDAKKGGDA